MMDTVQAMAPAAETCVLPLDNTTLEIYDRQMKRWIKIEIVEPVTITTLDEMGWKQTFTSYHIVIETNHWAFTLPNSDVRRRYSEFVWLRETLQRNHPSKNLPPLPPKRFFRMTKFNPSVIEERRFGLGKFLQRIMQSNEILCDPALHLFLQSDMTILEMEERLFECSRSVHAANMSRLNPRLMRSYSTGTGSGYSSYEESDKSCYTEETGSDAECMAYVDMSRMSHQVQADIKIFSPPVEMVDLTITHEDQDEVVLVANSYNDLPVLTGLFAAGSDRGEGNQRRSI